MNAPQLNLPIGIQTFSQIITDGYYYVDKTARIARLLKQDKYYFLSRPRRFGKSLLLDTLKELLECNEPLFRGLAVHDQWDWATPAPVIRVSFNDGGLETRQDLDCLPAHSNLKADAKLLSSFDGNTTSTTAILFQAGYLTIEKEELVGGNYYYSLRFPNRAVEQCLA